MTAAAPASRPGVLLDVDGTLLDTNYLQVLAWWRAFRDTGHDEVSMADCHRSIGIGSAELVTHLLGDDADDVDEVMEAKERRYEPLPHLCSQGERTFYRHGKRSPWGKTCNQP